MEFRRLRLAGFKSFVEATELRIEPGLTGVVAGDSVTVGLAAQFADRNSSFVKTVNYTSQLAGADAGNYALAGSTGSTTATILIRLQSTNQSVVPRVALAI